MLKDNVLPLKILENKKDRLPKEKAEKIRTLLEVICKGKEDLRYRAIIREAIRQGGVELGLKALGYDEDAVEAYKKLILRDANVRVRIVDDLRDEAEVVVKEKVIQAQSLAIDTLVGIINEKVKGLHTNNLNANDYHILIKTINSVLNCKIHTNLNQLKLQEKSVDLKEKLVELKEKQIEFQTTDIVDKIIEQI